MSAYPSSGPSSRPRANLKNLPAELKLHIFKYVLCPEVDDDVLDGSVVVRETPSTNGAGVHQYSGSMRWNISILLTSKAIYPAAMDALYSYMPHFIMHLTVESTMEFLLNVICPILLKRIEEITFTWDALRPKGWRFFQVRDTEWFVRQVLIARMTPQKGGCLRTIGIEMPDVWMELGSPLRVPEDWRWEWALVEQVIKGFAKGRFERLWFGYPVSYNVSIGARPRAFFNVRRHLARTFLGKRRASALESIFRFRAEEDVQQLLQNALAEAGVFVEHESQRESTSFMANALVLRRLPAPTMPV